jgi:hypothetical protein
MAVGLSICIPTWNRALILEHTLSRLPDLDCEFLVSDNCSTDETWGVVAAAGETDHRIRYEKLDHHAEAFTNLRHAIFHARGDLIAYMADDDSLLAAPLAEHVARMDAEPGLAAIYADPIAWDDAEEVELHRYFGITEARTFDNEPMGLANFLLNTMLPPEIGVFRRKAMIQSYIPFARMMPAHCYCYNLSRQGAVRFDPLAFYREHRVLKPHLQRGQTANLDLAMNYIGDEQRLGLEAMMLMALQDAGNGPINDEQRASIHAGIDRMLHTRTSLEITRAMQRGDFILAVELRRRQALWWGPGDVGSDMEHIIVPAAKQALRAYEGYDQAPTLGELVNSYRIGMKLNVTV